MAPRSKLLNAFIEGLPIVSSHWTLTAPVSLYASVNDGGTHLLPYTVNGEVPQRGDTMELGVADSPQTKLYFLVAAVFFGPHYGVAADKALLNILPMAPPPEMAPSPPEVMDLPPGAVVFPELTEADLRKLEETGEVEINMQPPTETKQ